MDRNFWVRAMNVGQFEPNAAPLMPSNEQKDSYERISQDSTHGWC